jgi:hypothetical protein
VNRRVHSQSSAGQVTVLSPVDRKDQGRDRGARKSPCRLHRWPRQKSDPGLGRGF